MSWFENLKIRKKLLTGFIFLTCLLVFIGVYSMFQVDDLVDSSVQVYESCTKPLGNLAFMTRDFYKLRINFRDLRNLNTLEEVKECEATFRKNVESLEKFNKDYAASIQTEAGRTAYDDYYNGFQEWEGYADKSFQLKKEKGKEKEFDNIFQIAAALGTSICEEKLESLVQSKDNLSVTLNDSNNASAAYAKILLIIIIVICAIVSIILAIWISSVISAPLVGMQRHAEYIATSGDLRPSGVKVGKDDEIGLLETSLVKMVTNFAVLIRDVISNIENINKESEGLSAVSDVSASTSVELQSQTQTAASSSEQVSANVSTVAHSVEELSASIKEISKSTTSATALTKKSEERANEASKVMNRLGQSSNEIGNIVKSITGIAEQTNLLALNATIEAARAGELGKGFAVVANEVKELAKESAKATEDITKKIKAIQDDTKNAIEVIQEIIANAVKINDVTTTIAAAVEEQSVTAHEVNRNITEATVGVNSIVEVITGITQAVNEYSKQANNVKDSSSTLKTLASKLDKQIKEGFKV